MESLRSALAETLAVGLVWTLGVLPAFGQAPVAVEKPMTKLQFIETFARMPQAEKFLPGNAQGLSDEEFYREVVKRLAARGAKGLEGSRPGDPLTRMEFVQIACVLAGGEPGASYMEQKDFLKGKGILDPKDIGHVKSFQGRVTVRRPDAPEPIPITGAEPVFFKDLEETAFGGRLELQFDDLSVLTIGEETVLEVNEMVYNPGTRERSVVLKLTLGTLRLLVSKAGGNSRFRVLTPTAVIGERGTEFVVSVDRAGATRVLTLQGMVAVRPLRPGAGPEVVVRVDQSVVVSAAGVVGRPMPLTPADRREALRATAVTEPAVEARGGILTRSQVAELLRGLAVVPLVVETYIPAEPKPPKKEPSARSGEPGGRREGPTVEEPMDVDEYRIPEAHEPDDMRASGEIPEFSPEEEGEEAAALPGADRRSFWESLTASEKSELVGLLGGFEFEGR